MANLNNKKLSLKACRVNANLTLERASELLGVSEATLCKWEKGKTSPRIDQVNLLCRLYKVPIENIFFD